MAKLERYKKRLDEWKREKKYNEYGMQYLADRAIKLLEQEIEEIESDKYFYSREFKTRKVKQ